MTSSPESPAAEGQGTEPGQRLMDILRTPYTSVFSTNEQGTEYFMPATLRGVPVTKIAEDDPYWETRWESLDVFLSKEDEEKRLVHESRARLNLDPENKAVQKDCKFHQDNMSKYHKIREIFGPNSSYHPNQLVSKPHMPEDGFCVKELMYRLACKVSDLQVLQRKGFLAMDPWDFIRWRVGLKIQERLTFPGERAVSFMRTVVYKLCDDGDAVTNPHGDPIMRQAAILAAKCQNRMGNYKTPKPSTTNGDPRPPPPPPPKKKRGRPGTRQARMEKEARAVEERRQERRARLAAVPSTYQGVNAFKAQMQARNVLRDGAGGS
ncbi:hypothetical protein CDD83_726 [Cordyceps sp. RAO-2017]|nr:hypothetical protein CDD83_726 [Cordyceps sp. RAO-2017]